MDSENLDKQFITLPLIFSTGFIYGNPRGSGEAASVNGGTLTLVDLGSGPIGVTCWHVLDGYRKRLQKDPGLHCQFKCAVVDPEALLVDESNAEALDIATFDLSSVDLTSLSGPGIQHHVFGARSQIARRVVPASTAG